MNLSLGVFCRQLMLSGYWRYLLTIKVLMIFYHGTRSLMDDTLFILGTIFNGSTSLEHQQVNWHYEEVRLII
jgi:hypothetical protein